MLFNALPNHVKVPILSEASANEDFCINIYKELSSSFKTRWLYVCSSIDFNHRQNKKEEENMINIREKRKR